MGAQTKCPIKEKEKRNKYQFSNRAFIQGLEKFNAVVSARS